MSVRGIRIWRRNDARFQPSILVEKNGLDGSLLFQGGAIATLDSDSTDVERRSYQKIVDAYGILGVLAITKDEAVLVAVTGVLSVGQLYGADILKITNVEFISLRTFGSVENVDSRIIDLQRLLSSQMFYFSSLQSYDLTRSAQHRDSHDCSDARFFWNRSLHFSFQRYGIDTDNWLLKCMAGSVLVRVVYVGANTGRVALISRLSCERVGTRFNVRGANYLGNVANFVETEQLLLFDEKECSLLQIRGSIPLFWEQPGVNVGSHKVKLRAFETSLPAYHRHLSQLQHRYGEFAIVNLLGRKEGERVLGDAFKTQHKSSHFAPLVDFIDFDYHAQMKISKEAIVQLKKKMSPHMTKHGFFYSMGKEIVKRQTGVIRTNCLDCLDRTNAVQTAIGLQMSHDQVAFLNLNAGKVNVEQRVEEILRDLWQKNGDQCSTIYAGTGALDGKSKLKDASRSLARTIQNNLMDGAKQESFDLFLTGAAYDPRLFDRACNILPPSLIQESYYYHEYADAVSQLVERSPEIAEPQSIKIFVGTWNVNGGKNIHNVAFRNESSLSHWIFANSMTRLVSVEDEQLADIVAIGVEELVDLNASNMVKASTTNQRMWCESIRKTLSEKAPFVLIGSEQLVGVCLFLFARPRVSPYLKDFAVASVKTGMGGATGNKGSVAFRIVVFSTSICFICSHFAAGQNEIRDRNEDFATTLKKIRFPLGREIDSHDVIFWLGDFNYRINLSGDEVKNAVRNGDYAKLVENDQLTQQKALGQTFVGFNEGQLTFAPTYKYDTFSDDYDTSEKCRAPAWTDRILWKDQRKKGKTQLLSYDRSELKTSDHRPVGAVFKVETFKVGGRKCVELIEDVVESMGPPDGTIIVSIAGKPRFPPQMFPPIHEKLKELGAQVQLSKFDDGDLWIVLNSGEMALAALSMDGLKIGGTDQINVKLKSPDWAYALKPHLSDFDLESFEVTAEEEALLGGTDGAVFEFADEDEDAISVSSLTLTGSAPDRPRPPSARSEAISVAKLEWPTEQPNVLSTSMPTRASSASLANSSWYEHVPPLAPPQSNNNKSPPQACLFNPFTQSAPSPAPPPSTIPLPPTRGASVGPGPPAVPVRKAPPPPPRPVIPPRPKNM
ncbi:Synaptojanin [Caenorhabditis elegans]|uniref:Synaptojanin n=1 Tax=Caenorhabditis elegans TaxID=6239 RepID=SYNJ_CAEEL|nr:Synaptojanin [Caenorhabditis elegans]G5ECL2.1 RecName: Full=Synaptojanin; AltName: Full=Synaptic inositol 1,4,5-trisphosphate 5-phosphatase; AltName: Full=Uncoordinated protein 26 [Caenorhabditis elegans]AAG18574.1 synaptojanin UNC-26A [Caenorhabditis elegans]CAC70096.1 Synaptojanin [Caenorhabditis elegans]|eukprot:NP_001023266.1 Synaptojanin [Caenorhabditis elegans]